MRLPLRGSRGGCRPHEAEGNAADHWVPGLEPVCPGKHTAAFVERLRELLKRSTRPLGVRSGHTLSCGQCRLTDWAADRLAILRLALLLLLHLRNSVELGGPF
jgi:hypothetical protein